MENINLRLETDTKADILQTMMQQLKSQKSVVALFFTKM